MRNKSDRLALLVDVTVPERNLIKIALEEFGFGIRDSSGIECLNDALSICPDIMVIDSFLTRTHDICSIIKTNQLLAHTPIFILTTSIGVIERARMSLMLVDGYIQKPVKVPIVKSILRHRFTNKSSNDETAFASAP